MRIGLFLFAISLFFIGCSNNKIKYNYPSDISGESHNAKNISLECIEKHVSHKIKLKAKSLTVEKIDGEKFINGRWAWKSTEWNNMWVSGLFDELTDGHYRIRIGVNPQSKSEVNLIDLIHEHGHYVSVAGLGIWGHDQRFSSCFNNWNDIKSSDLNIGWTTYATNGIIVHYYNGILDD